MFDFSVESEPFPTVLERIKASSATASSFTQTLSTAQYQACFATSGSLDGADELLPEIAIKAHYQRCSNRE